MTLTEEPPAQSTSHTREVDFDFDEIDTVQSLCRESFFEFVQEFWEVLIPEDPVWNWHIPYLCNEAQKMAERIFQRLPKEHDLCVNIPPGTTKSTIMSIMFPAWLWTRQPELRIISACYEDTLALQFAVKSRDLILSEKYQATFKFKLDDKQRWRPSTDADAESMSITLKDDQNAKGLYINMAHGERKSVGAGGNITGSHGHVIIVDDPINPKKAVEEASLRQINRWMRETLPSRKVDKKVAPTMLIMQRLHEDDPTGNMLKKKKDRVRHICLPAQDSKLVRPLKLRLRYEENGGFLDPIRLDQSVLDEQKEDLGAYGYAGQFEQNPVPEGGGIFEVGKVVLDQPAPRITDHNFIEVTRYWDKAGTKDGGKRTAGAKLGIDTKGRFWILDIYKGQWAAGEREERIGEVARADGEWVTVGTEEEGGSGGKESAERTVTYTLAGFRSYTDRPGVSKKLRAETWAPQVRKGNFYVPPGAEWWPDLKNEMAFFPFSKYSDQIDAISGAFARLVAKKMKIGSFG